MNCITRFIVVLITSISIVSCESDNNNPIEQVEEAIPDVKLYLKFNGTEGNVNVLTNNSLIVDDEITLEAFLRYQGGGGIGPRIIEIIDTFSIYYYQEKIWFCLYSVVYPGNQNNGWHCLSDPDTGINKWRHVAGSWDGQKMYLFLDGVLKGQTSFTGPLYHGGPGDQSLKIGNGWTSIDGFNGDIDEVRYSSVSRYDADFTPKHELAPDNNTVGLWLFDEGDGNMAMDESVNLNHGVITGSVIWGSE